MEGRPTLRLERVHIRGLRGLERLDLPEEGMGWEGRFPDVAMIGGANGSGKTTLLRCIVDAGHALQADGRLTSGTMWPMRGAEELRLDFALVDERRPGMSFRFLVGSSAFLDENGTTNACGFVGAGLGKRWFSTGYMPNLGGFLGDSVRFQADPFPRIVYFPSDTRELVVPVREKFQPVVLQDDAGFVAAWNRGLGTAWKGSTVELLFAARWADLNAKEEGRPEDATQFLNFTQAFSDMTGGRKQIGWSAHGELVVKLAEGGTHPLDELSAGERQILLLLAELRRTWRPGSLVLIDEPELHLHDAWQGQLYDILRAMQRELGGQVILTTQSHSLFEMAETGSRALLGRSGMT